jgi:hypothetical protein
MAYFFVSIILGLVFAGMIYSRDEDNTVLTVVGGVCWFLLMGVINYLCLPTLGWGYHGIWFEIFLTLVVAAIVRGSIEGEWHFVCWLPVAFTVVWIVLGLSSSEAFNSGKYQRMLEVNEVTFDSFSEDINVIPVDKMLVADYELASKVAEDKLEEDPGLGSRCDVGRMTLQNLTGSFVINNGVELKFDNDLIWVAPLEHSGFWRWVKNDVTPGYVIVYANDPTKRFLVTELNGQPLKMRYLESACFSEDIERHIRTNGYLSIGLTEHNFEIDPSGRPYWVLCNYEPTIGFSGGRDSKGVITVDIQSGEVAQYDMASAPQWIDHIQPEMFVNSQIRYWGEYKQGWWNSFLAKDGVQEPTPGMVLVYSEGESFWYTGISASKSALEGNTATSGFMLVNARTKEAKYYKVSGVNELEAKRIAEDQNFAKAAGYCATSPVLYNVKGNPTYFMTLKGSSGNVTGYAFVAVTNREAVGVGTSKKEAETNYLQSLRRSGNDNITDGPTITVDVKTFTVRDITVEGTTYYVLFNEVKGKEFTGSTEFFRELKWTKPGHKVNISYSEGTSDVVLIDTFDNLDFEF